MIEQLRFTRAPRQDSVGLCRPTLAFLMLALLFAGCRTSSDVAPSRDDPSDDSTVILISFDGFRWDYPEVHGAKTVLELAEDGVRAGLIPVFPTKTFPNHYSTVTGRYAENHGIVGNNMWDPVWDARFSLGRREEVENGRWWEGEPIWVTAEKQGVTAATYFWPGSEAPIQGVRPTYWKSFDDSVPGNDRVDEVLSWLELPRKERPRLITLYFSDVDSAGHSFGPEANETQEAVQRVDGYLERLIAGLKERRLYGTTNLILTADHGMAQMDPDRVIVLEDYIDVRDVRIIDLSVIAMMQPAAGKERQILEALEAAHPNLHVVPKADVPDRFHFSDHRRISSLVGWSDPGWYIYATHEQREARKARFSLGMHGFDNAAADMQGLFVARGPDFAPGLRVDKFENIHVYELIASILDLEPAPNDGSLDRARQLLRSGN